MDNISRSGLRHFSDIDADKFPEYFLRFLNKHAALPSVVAIKKELHDALCLTSGQSVVDVGCGTGDDVLMLSRITGPTGIALGIDHSAVMIARANEQLLAASGCCAKFMNGDAAALPLENGAVSASKMERVLCHLDQPLQALKELQRVTRAGGRVVILEPLTGRGTINTGERLISKRILNHLDGSIKNGQIGGALETLAIQAGLKVIALREYVVAVDAEWMQLVLILEKELLLTKQNISQTEFDDWWLTSFESNQSFMATFVLVLLIAEST